MSGARCNIHYKFALRQLLFGLLLIMTQTRFVPNPFKLSPRVFFSCLLLSHIFPLVYPLGVLTVKSQDRKRSIQYFKYPSNSSKVSPINRNEITRISERHVPNRILTESPSPFSCFPHIRVSALASRCGVCQSSHKINPHNIHYLDFETRLKTIRHMNKKERYMKTRTTKEACMTSGQSPSPDSDCPLFIEQQRKYIHCTL